MAAGRPEWLTGIVRPSKRRAIGGDFQGKAIHFLLLLFGLGNRVHQEPQPVEAINEMESRMAAYEQETFAY